MMDKNLTVKGILDKLGEMINQEVSKKNHTEGNLLKKVRSSIMMSQADSPERVSNIFTVRKEAIKAEGEGYMTIEEEELFNNTLEQLDYLDKVMKEFGL